MGDSELANLDSDRIVYNHDRTRAILLRSGDLFERDLKTGTLAQVTRGSNGLAAPPVRGRRPRDPVPRRSRVAQLEPRRPPGLAGRRAARQQGSGRHARRRRCATCSCA
ncbi:hypothetical protein LP419_10500 [Massilia sp. H-1]|nr:hypothetical protein LP419_10500 [Massilia sp. H-1]